MQFDENVDWGSVQTGARAVLVGSGSCGVDGATGPNALGNVNITCNPETDGALRLNLTAFSDLVGNVGSYHLSDPVIVGKSCVYRNKAPEGDCSHRLA